MLFVIDGSARDRLQDADDLLTSLLMEKELFGIPMVFLANKKDVEGIYHCQIKGGTSVSSASISTPNPFLFMIQCLCAIRSTRVHLCSKLHCRDIKITEYIELFLAMSSNSYWFLGF